MVAKRKGEYPRDLIMTCGSCRKGRAHKYHDRPPTCPTCTQPIEYHADPPSAKELKDAELIDQLRAAKPDKAITKVGKYIQRLIDADQRKHKRRKSTTNRRKAGG